MTTSPLYDTIETTTTTAFAVHSAPAQGDAQSAGTGITGGYTGNSLSLKIILGFLFGLSLYNAIELLVLIFATFNRYRGLYFWSLIIAGAGIVPYSLGFLIKFFQILDPNKDIGYVAIALLTIGWWTMITGQSVVLWSRLHLLTNSRRVLRYTLYMIITNAFCLHIPTTILTFGANANHFSDQTLSHFVNGYSIMEKIQMAGFFIQETILSVVYIKETLRLLNLSQSVQDDLTSVIEQGDPRSGHMRKTMYQLLAINAIIIAMDIVLLSCEFANLYLIQTVLKGAIYSIKLKLEFAVLSKLVQIVVTKRSKGSGIHSSLSRRNNPPTVDTTEGELTKALSHGTTKSFGDAPGGQGKNSTGALALHPWPSFVDPARISGDRTHAQLARTNSRERAENEYWEIEVERKNRRFRTSYGSWIDVEMNKHNIG